MRAGRGQQCVRRARAGARIACGSVRYCTCVSLEIEVKLRSGFYGQMTGATHLTIQPRSQLVPDLKTWGGSRSQKIRVLRSGSYSQPTGTRRQVQPRLNLRGCPPRADARWHAKKRLRARLVVAGEAQRGRATHSVLRQRRSKRLRRPAAALRKQLREQVLQESGDESDLSLESDDKSDDEEAQVVTSRPNAKCLRW